MHKLIIISAPSGCGKSSLIQAIIQQQENLVLSISHTTRKIRHQEVDGIDYHFVNFAKFSILQKNGVFVEYAKVFDNYYGTSKNSLENSLKINNVIVEIDWQGARQLRQYFQNNISIFIQPPSIQALKDRLKNRGDDNAIIQRRMLDAKNEISHANEYDYQITNDDFDKTVKKIITILSYKKLVI